MIVRHFATLIGLMTLVFIITLGLVRYNDPTPYLIVTDTVGDVFLYNETSLISVSKDWSNYTFSGGQQAPNRRLYAITPDGWLVMGYGPNSSPMRSASFKFNPLGTIARPVMPGEAEAGYLTATPDKEWIILYRQGFFYRQRVGSNEVELITDQGPLAFRAWLSDNHTLLVSDNSERSRLQLLDFRTGEIKPVEMEGAFVSVGPSLEPGWFWLRESFNTGQAIYHVNFETGERIELLSPGNNAALVVGLDATRQWLVYMSITNQTDRELWRLDSDGETDFLIEDVAFTVWSPDHTILLVYTELVQQRGLWLIPTDTWQPLQVYTTTNRYLSFGYWLDDEILFTDGNSIFSASQDDGSWETLYQFPVRSLVIKETSPDGEWLIVQGQDASFKNWLFEIRPDGSEMKTLLPENFDLSNFHGWLPVTSFDWHFLPFLGIGGIFMVVGRRGLRRRGRARLDLLP